MSKSRFTIKTKNMTYEHNLREYEYLVRERAQKAGYILMSLGPHRWGVFRTERGPRPEHRGTLTSCDRFIQQG